MKIIKIGIDGGDNYPKSTIKSGISRLVSSFVCSIPEKYSSKLRIYYYYFAKKNIDSPNKIVHDVNLPRRFFSLFFVPLRCFWDRVDVYMGFSGIVPSFIRLFRKTIVFIHDFGFYDYPAYYKDSKKLVWQTNYAIYAANKIVVFSRSIQRQLLERFPKIAPQKVILIYPGVNHLKKREVMSVKNLPRSFFLYVGVIKKIKNVEKLLSLFSLYLIKAKKGDVKLILIGNKEKTYWDYLSHLPVFAKVKQNVIFLENISDEQLYWYYKNCIALLNTSYVEGFCYPVVEALSIGKKVITNNLSLYSEFKPYFKGLHVTVSDKEFLVEMLDEPKKNVTFPIKNHPFYWNTFTTQLLTVVRSMFV